MIRTGSVLLFTALIAISALSAQETQETSRDSIQNLDEVIIKANTILGNKYVAQNRTGASYYLSSDELQDFSYIDINRALKSVPGVNLYEEDGFGLRPNISLRGTSLGANIPRHWEKRKPRPWKNLRYWGLKQTL